MEWTEGVHVHQAGRACVVTQPPRRTSRPTPNPPRPRRGQTPREWRRHALLRSRRSAPPRPPRRTERTPAPGSPRANRAAAVARQVKSRANRRGSWNLLRTRGRPRRAPARRPSDLNPPPTRRGRTSRVAPPGAARSHWPAPARRTRDLTRRRAAPAKETKGTKTPPPPVPRCELCSTRVRGITGGAPGSGAQLNDPSDLSGLIGQMAVLKVGVAGHFGGSAFITGQC